MKEKRTHHGYGSRKRKFDYYEKRRNKDGSVDVLGWGTYEITSVLAGQAKKMYLDSFENEAAAEAVYGDMNWYSSWTSPQVSVAHLPG